RQRGQKRRQSSSSLPMGLDGFTITLIGLGVFGLLSMGLSLISPVLAFVPMVLGSLVALAGGLWFLMLAFQDSAVAGLLCLFVPFYSLFYLVTHFDEVKRPFFLQLVGGLIVGMGVCAGAFSAQRKMATPTWPGEALVRVALRPMPNGT